MKIAFWKMEGGGNDFVVVDNRGSIIGEEEKVRLSRLLLERKFGIGGDQLILLEKSHRAHFRMRIFNPDGSEAEMCGNGARCAARFAYETGISPREMEFETLAGIISGKVMGRRARVLLTPPRDLRLDFALEVEGKEVKVSFVNTGVPHVIREVENLEEIEVKEEGRKIRYHPYFQPQGTNVDFVKWDKNACWVRVYERGVEDETLCCGTGAVASAYIGIKKGILASPARVIFIKGREELVVSVEEGERVYLEGSACVSFIGEYKGERVYGEKI